MWTQYLISHKVPRQETLNGGAWQVIKNCVLASPGEASPIILRIPTFPGFFPAFLSQVTKQSPELEISGVEEHLGSPLTLTDSPFKFQGKIAKLGVSSVPVGRN